METFNIRRRNLKRLVSRYGTQQALANAVGLAVQYINHLLSGHRSIGEKTARKIEAALQLDRGWMDRDEFIVSGSSPVEAVNFETGPEITRQVPLISWVQAGYWESYEVLPLDDVTEWIPAPSKLSHRAFALRVRGDSMEPKFPEGVCIVVEPDVPARHGNYVVVRLDGVDECTFKQLVEDSGKCFLKPLNPRYPLIEINSHATIIGVVRGIWLSV